MSRRTSRREFLRDASLAGAGAWGMSRLATAQDPAPDGKLNIGLVGVGGRGFSNLEGVGGENVVALCDVDDQFLDAAARKFPAAQRYNDFRKLLEQKNVEAVVVSTPDHVHAFASVMAMKLGKHVYCEKPLTHSVYEARVVAETAARQKVVTQMGNQGRSGDGKRRVVELIQSGAIGAVREVHSWTDRPGRWWPAGIDRPVDTPEVPAHVHWDLWLGPAPDRPYHPAYHPFKWRGWWDFGTGALGDMACHILDAPWWALKLGAPATVEAEGEPRRPETEPNACIVRYEFPARGELPPVTLTWYHGGKLPPAELTEGEKLNECGNLFVGEKGKLLTAREDSSRCKLLPAARYADFPDPKPFLPRVPKQDHHVDWIRACKTGGRAVSDFSYAGPLTEAVLLGVVALRVGRKLEWDAAGLKARNCPEADAFIRREYRKGWAL